MKHALSMFATPAVPVSTIRHAMPGQQRMSAREAIELELDQTYLEMQEEAELEAIRCAYASKASRSARLGHAAGF